MRSKPELSTTGILGILLCLMAGPSRGQTLNTPAEACGYQRYTQTGDIERFLSTADLLSRELGVQVIGRTKEGPEFGAQDLFLCILSEERALSPKDLNRDKPTLFVFASQHGNEQSGKEAALRLIRDLAFGELKPLLGRMNFLIVPQTNPYGNRVDRRADETGLDMNRDHEKLESGGALAIHRAFRTWMPEVTCDLHEKGESYYKVSVGCVSNVNIHRDILEYSRSNILPEIGAGLVRLDMTFQEYLVTEDLGTDTSSGARSPEPAPAGPKEEMKRFSTSDLNDGRNSLGIFETLSFIQEVASRHDLESLRIRTDCQYSGVRLLAESVAARAGEVLSLVRGRRADLLARAQSPSATDTVHLRMEYRRDPAQARLVLNKYATPESRVLGILKKDMKAGETLTDEELAPSAEPSSAKVVEEVVKNWFPLVIPTLSVHRPLGYIIPAVQRETVETLLRLGIDVGLVIRDAEIEAEAYETVDVLPAREDCLPPEKLEVEKRTLRMIVKTGDFYVSSAQAGANLIPSLLEPQSQYGLVRYGKFNLAPKKGDFFAFYRIVKKPDLALAPYKNWPRGSV